MESWVKSRHYKVGEITLWRLEAASLFDGARALVRDMFLSLESGKYEERRCEHVAVSLPGFANILPTFFVERFWLA